MRVILGASQICVYCVNEYVSEYLQKCKLKNGIFLIAHFTLARQIRLTWSFGLKSDHSSFLFYAIKINNNWEIFLFSNKNNPSKEGAKIHRAPAELDLYRVLEKICTIGKKISLSEQISNW